MPTAHLLLVCWAAGRRTQFLVLMPNAISVFGWSNATLRPDSKRLAHFGLIMLAALSAVGGKNRPPQTPALPNLTRMVPDTTRHLVHLFPVINRRLARDDRCPHYNQ